MPSKRKNVLLVLFFAIVVSLGIFWIYAAYISAGTVLVNEYALANTTIQELEVADISFDLSVFERDDVVSLERNGTVPVEPSLETGRSDPFSF